MRFLLNGERIITAETPFYFENMEFTARRVPPERWAEIGLEELVETPRGDERFWIISERIEIAERKIYYDKTPKDLNEVKAMLVAQIKEEAQALIYAKLPIWKQTNLISAGVELLYTRLEKGSWDEAETVAANTLLATIGKTKTVRAHSNALEAEVLALTTVEELEAWRSHDWPEL